MLYQSFAIGHPPGADILRTFAAKGHDFSASLAASFAADGRSFLVICRNISMGSNQMSTDWIFMASLTLATASPWISMRSPCALTEIFSPSLKG